MDDAMVEKVARAITIAMGEIWREPPYNKLHTDALNNRARHITSAAIAAMAGEPVAWLKPNWNSPESFDGMSPVTIHRIAGWIPLYAIPGASHDH